MVTLFIILFTLMCFSGLLVWASHDDEITWQIAVWRAIFTLSCIGTVGLFFYILMSEFGFKFMACVPCLFVLAFVAFLGVCLWMLIFVVITWIFGKDGNDLVAFLTGFGERKES